MKKLILFLLISFNLNAQVNKKNSSEIAQVKEGGNGGDSCEMRIKEIRDDLISWIDAGGHKDLALPKKISHDFYQKRMQKVLKKTKISCVLAKRDLEESTKTCRVVKVANGYEVKCFFLRFQATDDAHQYRMIHHEFAVAAKIEKNKGEDSDYSVSNQVTDYLESQVVKRLAIKGSYKVPKLTPVITRRDNGVKKYCYYYDNKTGNLTCFMSHYEAKAYCDEYYDGLPNIKDIVLSIAPESYISKRDYHLGKKPKDTFFCELIKGKGFDSFYFCPHKYTRRDFFYWSSSGVGDKAYLLRNLPQLESRSNGASTDLYGPPTAVVCKKRYQ